MRIRSAFFTTAFLFCSFLGGAVAQIIGGGGFIPARAATAWIALIGSLSGPETPTGCVGGTCYDINAINITGDSISTGSGSSTTQINGVGVHHVFGGSALTGYVNGQYTTLDMTATTGNINGNYVSNLAIATASANDNGTLGAPAGSIWASNPNAFLGSGATFWLALIGQEIDVTAGSGSSVADKLGQMIVQGSADGVVGTRSNIASSIANQNGAQGWDCGYCFGQFSGAWAFNPTSTLIGAWAHGIPRNSSGGAVPTNNAGTALYGVDFSNVTFAAGGAPYLAPLITPASSGAACRQGSIEWDASFIYICTATNTFKRATLAAF